MKVESLSFEYANKSISFGYDSEIKAFGKTYIYNAKTRNRVIDDILTRRLLFQLTFMAVTTLLTIPITYFIRTYKELTPITGILLAVLFMLLPLSLAYPRYMRSLEFRMNFIDRLTCFVDKLSRAEKVSYVEDMGGTHYIVAQNGDDYESLKLPGYTICGTQRENTSIWIDTIDKTISFCD